MKIAVDTSPVSMSSSSAHKVRGVGAYINMLVTNLRRFDKSNEYVFVEDKNFPHDADIVHYPYFDPFFITLPNKFPTKTVVTVHDLTPLVFPKHFPSGIKGKIKWLIQRSRLKKANMVVVDSDCSGRDVRDIGGVVAERIRTVYLAADERFVRLKPQDLSDVRNKFLLPDNFLLYVGDATWNKNLPRLIAAVSRTKYQLIMVGKVWENRSSDVSDNSWNLDLKKVLSEIESNKQFMRLGFVSDDDLVKIYNLAGALMMPSMYEGFGLPVLEAMSCGCPVICSKKGSLPEVGGDAVLYIDEQNSENISKGIEKVINDESFKKQLSQKGLEQSKKFSVEKSIKDLVTIYEQI